MRDLLIMLISAFLILITFLNIKIVNFNIFTLGAGVFFSGFILQGAIDLLNWKYGRKEVQEVFLKATIVKLFLIGVVIISIYLPSAKAFLRIEPMWENFMGKFIQLSLAVEAMGFLRNYFIDPFVFDKLRKRGWLASSFGSDLAGETFMSLGSTFIGYATWGYPLLAIALSRIAYRMIISVLKTIILYPVARRISGK